MHGYVGSGPYCYANSLAMMMGKHAPSTAVIEFATSSPFGMQFIGDNIVFFDPYNWDPAQAFDEAIEAAGWKSMSYTAKDADDALATLKNELERGPVFVGPVEMGYLRYNPDSKGPIGADHYVVVLGIEGDRVDLHDPHGHPYASIPAAEFMKSWRTDSLGYGKSYSMRFGFARVDELCEEEVIRRSLPNSRKWLSARESPDMPPGSAANGEAALKLAKLVDKGLPMGIKMPMVHFAIRVGARRLIDGAACLGRVGLSEASQIMDTQARLVGRLQYPLVVGDNAAASALLRELAPTYEKLQAAMEKK